jgi:myo-inositol-1(or 4)-monophosphatase
MPEKQNKTLNFAGQKYIVMTNPEGLSDKTLLICEETAAFIRKNFRNIKSEDVITKAVNSMVSYVDREAEIMITDGLKRLLPEAGFLTEENMVKNEKADLRWIIDPLDGTTNYVTGIPHFSISIALSEDDEIVFGAVYDVMQQVYYHATLGGGAFRDDTKIRVNPARPVHEMLIATGYPYDKSLITVEFERAHNYFMHKSRCIRRLGSAALDLCFFAQGTFDLYFEMHLNDWDIAAGKLIAEEAGGMVTNLTGGTDLSDGHIIAIAPDAEEVFRWLLANF